MIVHLFNSSSVSGPERLVLPALASARDHFMVINLREERIESVRESDPLEEYARSLHLDYRDIAVCGRWDSVAIRHLRLLLERANPDLVHAHDVKASAYLLQAKDESPSSRYHVVSTHHGIHGRPSIKTRLYESFYRRFILKSFERILCVSSADYHYLLNSGMDQQKVRLQLNGIDGRAVDLANRFWESQRVRAQWLPTELSRDTLFLFGVVGRLSAEKDHDRLFRVLSLLNRTSCQRDWKCLIFGTGPLEKSLRQTQSLLGLDKRIVWMGYRENVGAELAGLDLLLSFSKAEGLPINLLEAGWAGTPAMATRIGGIIDVIPDDRYGQLIDPREPVQTTTERLVTCLSKEGQAQLHKQAILFQNRVMSDFTQSKWTQRLKAIYGEMKVEFSELDAKATIRLKPEKVDQGTLTQRLKSIFFTRLMLYPTGRLGAIRRWNRDGFRILMYHHFPAHTQDALQRQCAHITSHYTVVSLMDIAHSMRGGPALPANALAVTVDDGYGDFLRNGYPIFHAYHIPVTVYLVSDFIDKRMWLWWDEIQYTIDRTLKKTIEVCFHPGQPPSRFLLATAAQRRGAIETITEALKEISNEERLQFLKTLRSLLEVDLPASPPLAMAPLEWSDIRTLAENGVEFGAHTKTHPILSRVHNSEELVMEISDGKRRIEEKLKRPVVHFCYPNGQREDIHDHTFDILNKNQFHTAVTAERGVNFRGADPFWLRRIGVSPVMNKFNFEALVAGLGGSRARFLTASGRRSTDQEQSQPDAQLTIQGENR